MSVYVSLYFHVISIHFPGQQMVAWRSPSYSEITGQRVCFRGRCAGLASGAPCAVGASKREIVPYSHHKNLKSPPKKRSLDFSINTGMLILNHI